MDNKLVSVVMSVYNTKENYLRQAIESILNQTYDNFEFIIINDASTDNSLNVIKSYKDERIVIVENKENFGLTKSLNVGLNLARGKYIARMDSDDISIKSRFKLQFNFMEENNHVDVLGGVGILVDSQKYMSGYLPNNQNLIKIRMLFYNCGMPHSSAFIRKEFLDKYAIKYDEQIKKAQDYALWVECLKYGHLYSLPEVVVYYRIHNQQISFTKKDEQDDFANIIRMKQLNLLYSGLAESEQEEFIDIVNVKINTTVKNCEKVILKLIEINKIKRVYDIRMFEKEIMFIWVIKGLRRLKKLHTLDFFCSKIALKALLPQNFIYLINCFFKENNCKKKIVSKFIEEGGTD